jgi:hypothetical protein
MPGNKAKNLVFFCHFANKKRVWRAKEKECIFSLAKDEEERVWRAKEVPHPSISPTLVINGNIKFLK